MDKNFDLGEYLNNNLEEKAKFVEATNYLIDLLNKNHCKSLGFYTKLTDPNGNERLVPIEFGIAEED